MKIDCEIIRDILPLYAEDLVSQPTRNMVEEHLADCDGCTKELEALRKPQKLPVQTDASGLKRVGQSIRRRRILAVMAILLFVATLIIGGALMLDARIYLSANDAVQDIQVEGKTVHITWNPGIIGTRGECTKDGKGNYAVTAWTNLYNLWFTPERVPYDQLGEEVQALMSREQYEAMDNRSSYTMEDDQVPNFIYVNPNDNSMTLLLNSGRPFPEEPLMQVDHIKGYYAAGMAALAVVIFLTGMLFKESWYGEAAQRIGIVFGCVALSAVVVTAGHFASINQGLQETIIDSSAVALPMSLCALCVRQIILFNRKDKGL